MDIICEHCHKKFRTIINSTGNITIEGESRVNAPCSHCHHVNQLSDLKIQFDAKGEVESVTPLNNQTDVLRFFDKR
jgi:hypothetical protein